MAENDGNGFETILLTRRERTATITLNRPERLNAINEQMRREIITACDELAYDTSVSVVILKGSGRAFSAGHDIYDGGELGSGREFHPGDTAYDWLNCQRKQEYIWKIWDLPKPVIAQVHGHAMGLAACLMTMCDLIVVAKDARIGNARTIMGAGMEGPKFLWAVGMRRAKWLDLLPGWRITGEEAVDWGWANLAVAAEDLDEEVTALADQLSQTPLSHLMFRKASLNRVYEQMGFRSSIAANTDFDPLAHKSDDGIELENRSARAGFIEFGKICSTYPARHDRD
jgi:enoyl-CoA hydratase